MLKKIIILSLSIFILSSCSDINDNQKNISNNTEINENKTFNFKTVSVENFKKEIEKNDGILIDLRTNDEVVDGVIPGAVQIDYYSSNFNEKINSLDKNKKYLIYCRSGSRSGKTFELMKYLGFKYVINLDGGIGSWINSGEKLGVLGKSINDKNIKYFTIEEVEKHNINSDCWTIIENKVYNITSFFGIHPGGDGKLEVLCGIDGTSAFNNKHGTNEKAQIKKDEYYIGDLK